MTEKKCCICDATPDDFPWDAPFYRAQDTGRVFCPIHTYQIMRVRDSCRCMTVREALKAIGFKKIEAELDPDNPTEAVKC